MSGNMDNLKKGLSPEEARTYGRMGGKKSGEVRRQRKALRECLDLLLAEKVEDGETRADVISAALIRKAMGGDVKAFEVIRDTVGEKPMDRVAVAEVDPSAIADVERMVLGYSGDDDTGAGC
jgi:hypothetical protein